MATSPEAASSFRKAGSALIAFCIACTIWEFVGRNFIFHLAQRVPISNGLSIRQGHIVWSEEGYARTDFDKNGIRTPVPTDEEGTSILVLGDSFSEALHVKDSDVYTQVLKRDLDKKGIATRIFNAGVGRAAPPRHIQMADWYKERLKPDLVIIQLHEGDFGDDFLTQRKAFFSDAPDKAKAMTSEKESDPMTALLGGMPGYGVLRDASLVQMLARKAAMDSKEASTAFGRGHKPEVVDPALIEEELKPYTKWVAQNFREKFPRLVVVYVPIIDYNKPTTDQSYSEALILRELEAQGIPAISMRKPFVNFFTETKRPCNGFVNSIPGQGHLNRDGHRLVGEALVELTAKEIKGQ